MKIIKHINELLKQESYEISTLNAEETALCFKEQFPKEIAIVKGCKKFKNRIFIQLIFVGLNIFKKSVINKTKVNKWEIVIRIIITVGL